MKIQQMQIATDGNEFWLTAQSASTGKTVYWDGAGWSLLRSSARKYDSRNLATKLWRILSDSTLQPQPIILHRTRVVH